MSDKKILTREEIIAGFETLALSQGYYGRLCEAIDNATEEQKDCFFEQILAIEPTSMVDVILFLEC